MAAPPTAAADLLILEFVAGNRRIPHAVFHRLLEYLSSHSAFPCTTSQHLRQTLVLRALDAALHTNGEGAPCSFVLLLRKARQVLADPAVAACFPHQIHGTANEDNDEARAAATVAGLRRLLDIEWANLPPPTLQRAAADLTNRTKLGLLVGESTEGEILGKLVQDGSATDAPKVADNVKDANEADGAGRDDEVPSSDETSETDAGQQGMAGLGHQNASVKGAEGQVSDKSVHAHASKKRNLMERNPNAGSHEWDGSDDDQPVRKRKSRHVERQPSPSPTCAPKIRNKWSEIEKKTLLEAVEKYGRGNWKVIKLAYPDVFKGRSTVDLKDKLRNLEKYHHGSACVA